MNAINSSTDINCVSVENISFSYHLAPVLNNISLKISRGKIVAIMGGSGCGKTTLLRLITGQYKPDSGRILLDEQDLSSLSTERLYSLRHRIGMLFQQGALFTDLNVFDNVAFQIREHTDLPEELIRILVLMKLHAVGLHGAASLKTSELSGGMARRVALARATALDPDLMLYDEPFAGLDPISLGMIGESIHRLNDALDATSIIVTHDIQESLNIVDYVYLIKGGCIVAEGTPDMIKQSDIPYVRQFITGSGTGPVDFHFPAKDYHATLMEDLT